MYLVTVMALDEQRRMIPMKNYYFPTERFIRAMYILVSCMIANNILIWSIRKQILVSIQCIDYTTDWSTFLWISIYFYPSLKTLNVLPLRFYSTIYIKSTTSFCFLNKKKKK